MPGVTDQLTKHFSFVPSLVPQSFFPETTNKSDTIMTPLASLSPPHSPTTTTTTNGPSFRRAVKVALLLLLLVQTHYLYQNFVPNKNEKALHGARMTTVMDLSDSSSLAWNYNINQSSPGFEDEGVEPKANTTSQSVRMTTPVNRLLLNGTISIKVLPDLKRKGKNQRPTRRVLLSTRL